MSTKHHYESLWISDIHLGCKDCKAEFLLAFLKSCEVKRIFLVGDIVDFWALNRRTFWPEAHNKVFNHLLELSQQGVEVIYIPGNHDDVVRSYQSFNFAGMKIHQEYIHETVSGKKLLLLHGDKFDQQVCFGRFHAKLGDALYDLLLFLNRQLHKARKATGRPYWSLASYLKTKVKKANEAIERYKQAALSEAKLQQVDGVVCGHIHHPQICLENGLMYCNDGDWVENCTVLVETELGDLKLLRWNDAIDNVDVLGQVNWSKQQQNNNNRQVDRKWVS
ncbi:UDP-2,3-diacylglucosamine diphosphatase [Psychrosphaera haliotis]|uniref:UDP-2,3-diacylglucosamine diphosphatase n=1 Tax=Psychrosphaera haliotis TaxID=555083 RepID=UPI00236C9B1A|nr:UDP-2,3-diacylglucosamine diphosphatase [Psychrosphaera haliotis]